MFFDPKNFLGMIPEEDREKAADLLDQKGAVLEEFRFQTFSCPACKHYESKLKGVISLGGRQVYQTDLSCSQCGSPLEEQDHFQPPGVCPECRSRNLITGMGEWD